MFKALCSLTLSALLVFSAVAQTNPGSAQSGTAPSTLVGCVQKTGDIYTLTDETSKVTAQLRGGSLKDGRHVQVSGTQSASATPAGGATQVLDVTRVTSVAGNCQAPTAGSSFMSGSAEHKRATFVAIFVIAAVTAGAAIATASRQGSARGTTNNDAPAINH
jgi:hypothetical protein